MKILRSKYFIFYTLFFLFTVALFAQSDVKRFKLAYVNENGVELFYNRESYFPNDKVYNYKGFGTGISSLHGLFLTQRIALLAGIGIVWNFNENFKAIPIFIQLEYNFYGQKRIGPLIFINVSPYLSVGSFTRGHAAQIGFKYIAESDFNYNIILGLFARSSTYLLNKQTNFNYQTESFGASIGIQF